MTPPRLDLLTRLRSLDMERVRRCLVYDETSPTALRWGCPATDRSNVVVGSTAGSFCPNGYVHVTFSGKVYKGHHLVLLLHDVWPADGEQCDHIDRDPRNNRISNLRWVRPSINQRNRVVYNKTGFSYVVFEPKQPLRPYVASYKHPETRRKVSVGSYPTAYEAHLAAITHRLEHCWNP